MECGGEHQLGTHCKHPATKKLGIGAVFSGNQSIFVHFSTKQTVLFSLVKKQESSGMQTTGSQAVRTSSRTRQVTGWASQVTRHQTHTAENRTVAARQSKLQRRCVVESQRSPARIISSCLPPTSPLRCSGLSSAGKKLKSENMERRG